MYKINKSFIQILAVTIVLSVFALTAPVSVFGQTTPINENGQTVAPQLYVADITVIGEIFEAGQVVDGSFTLFNVGLGDALDVGYTVGLVDLIELDGFFYPVDEIGVSEKKQLASVAPGQQVVRFNYEIPSVIPDVAQLGIIIRAYRGETFDALEYLPLQISGNKQTFVRYVGSLSLGDGPYDTFGLLEGPNVLDGEDVVISVDFSNSPFKPSDITPTVSLFKGNSKQGELVTSAVGESFSLTATDQYIQSYLLPSALEPGVYTASIAFTDAEGMAVAVPLEARYIIEGIKPKIDTVYFTETDQNKLYSFDVAVVYQDTPVSARKNDDGTFMDPRAETYFTETGESNEGYVPPTTLTANVSLFDEVTGVLIAESESSFDGSTESIVSFEPISDYANIRVSVELRNGDELLDTDVVSVMITPRTNVTFAAMLQKLFGTNGFLVALSAVVIVLIVLVVMVVSFIRKKRVVLVQNEAAANSAQDLQNKIDGTRN